VFSKGVRRRHKHLLFRHYLGEVHQSFVPLPVLVDYLLRQFFVLDFALPQQLALGVLPVARVVEPIHDFVQQGLLLLLQVLKCEYLTLFGLSRVHNDNLVVEEAFAHETQHSKNLEIAHRESSLRCLRRKVNQGEGVTITSSLGVGPRSRDETIVEAHRLFEVAAFLRTIRQGAVLLRYWVVFNTLGAPGHLLGAARHLDHAFDCDLV